jgi:flavodoxin
MSVGKVAVIYYSRTNNTEKAVEFLKERMEEKDGRVRLVRIIAEKDPNFFKALSVAKSQQSVTIRNTDFDLSDYDTIVFGVPSWAYYPAPFYKSFLKHVEDIDNKKIGVLLCAGVSIQRNLITMKRFKEELGRFGIQYISAELILIVRKGKLVDGEQHVDMFIEKLL